MKRREQAETAAELEADAALAKTEGNGSVVAAKKEEVEEENDESDDEDVTVGDID